MKAPWHESLARRTAGTSLPLPPVDPSAVVHYHLLVFFATTLLSSSSFLFLGTFFFSQPPKKTILNGFLDLPETEEFETAERIYKDPVARASYHPAAAALTVVKPKVDMKLPTITIPPVEVAANPSPSREPVAAGTGSLASPHSEGRSPRTHAGDREKSPRGTEKSPRDKGRRPSGNHAHPHEAGEHSEGKSLPRFLGQVSSLHYPRCWLGYQNYNRRPF